MSNDNSSSNNSNPSIWLYGNDSREDYSDCPVCKDVKTINQDLFIVQLIFPALTLTANLITSIAIYRAKSMTFPLRLSLLNLSLTDLTASVIYFYHIGLSWTKFEVDMECIARYALFVGSVTLTIITVLFLSMDRCLCLVATFIYQRYCGTLYVKVSIFTTWIMTILYVWVGFSFIRPDAEGCFYPLLVSSVTHCLYSVVSLPVIIVIIVLNSIMLGTARSQITKIASTMVGDERQQRISQLGMKAAMTTVSIVIPFILLNTPLYSLMLYFVRYPAFTKTSTALYLVNAMSTISLFNSLLNPVIYVWRCDQVRFQLKKILQHVTSIRAKIEARKSSRQTIPDRISQSHPPVPSE